MTISDVLFCVHVARSVADAKTAPPQMIQLRSSRHTDIVTESLMGAFVACDRRHLEVHVALDALRPDGHGLHVGKRLRVGAVAGILLARVDRIAGRVVPELHGTNGARHQ